MLFSKFIYTVSNWTNVLLSSLINYDWDIFCQIINDCNQKFLLFFWQVLFNKLDIKLLTFMIYYSQMNDQFKYTNQTVEIAFWYFLTLNSDKVFTTILLYLQGSLNNSWNLSTDYAFNELFYRFCTNNTFNMISSANLALKNYSRLHQIYCEDAEHIIIFANVMSKHYYNAKHTLLIIDEMIYLWLFHEYIISDLTNQKFLNQQVKSFYILECIDHLVYQLKLSFTMWIHSVISIAQLKLTVLSDFDLYNWQLNTNSLSVENNISINNDAVETASLYKIERLLNKHIKHHEHDQFIIKYLVKWKSYNHSHNVWYDIQDLTKTKKLITDYEQKATTTFIYDST